MPTTSPKSIRPMHPVALANLVVIAIPHGPKSCHTKTRRVPDCHLRIRPVGWESQSYPTWYYRHWKGMNLDPDTTPTYSMEEWDSQCKADWRVNGELEAQKKQAKQDKKAAAKALKL